MADGKWQMAKGDGVENMIVFHVDSDSA